MVVQLSKYILEIHGGIPVTFIDKNHNHWYDPGEPYAVGSFMGEGLVEIYGGNHVKKYTCELKVISEKDRTLNIWTLRTITTEKNIEEAGQNGPVIVKDYKYEYDTNVPIEVLDHAISYLSAWIRN
ncbi:MAG: hypothetical protein K8R53_08520 [Bacteroidales bacterium]|nr:hypothetical protein [Bacteroidales bacterium]